MEGPEELISGSSLIKELVGNDFVNGNYDGMKECVMLVPLSKVVSNMKDIKPRSPAMTKQRQKDLKRRKEGVPGQKKEKKRQTEQQTFHLYKTRHIRNYLTLTPGRRIPYPYP